MKHLPDFQHINTNIICDTCQISKFHRLPFHSNNHISPNPFDLIHVDIWGPYKHLAIDGSSYFLTIIEDHSRCIWTHLMSAKTQVPLILKSFFNYVQNHFQTTVKALRSDNGQEFLIKECNSLFQQSGIIHQLSVCYTPQQNSVVERKHRHLLDIARAIKLHANLPANLWGECILAAAYLVNRMPTPVLAWKSPFPILFHKPPTIDHLRNVGCLCYAAIQPKTHDKFGPKGQRCIFLSYSPN